MGSLLTRFELMNYRAQAVSGLAVNIVGKSWLILHHLGIPKEKWPLLLAPTQGMLPNTDAQYTSFLEYCRRNAHMWENFGEKSLQPRYHSSTRTGYPVWGQGEEEEEEQKSLWAVGEDHSQDADNWDDSEWYDCEP